jgi:hypothetical protein
VDMLLDYARCEQAARSGFALDGIFEERHERSVTIRGHA